MSVCKFTSGRIKYIIQVFYAVLLIAALGEGNTSHAQDNAKEFTPHGSPFVKVFFNYNTKINEGKGSSAFEIQRAYLGYNYYFSKEVSLTVNTDVGNPKNNSEFYYTVFLKNAFLNYNKNDWNIDLGLINTKNFKVQEDFWGNRYIEKSAQDLYKMCPSADFGVSVSRKFNEKISADFTMRNGEGYKNFQSDNYFYYGTGVTLKPVSPLLIRFYYEAAPQEKMRSSIAGFAGYTWKKFRLGAEYTKDLKEKFIADQDLNCFSTYAAYSLSKKFELFARFDGLSSEIKFPVYYPGTTPATDTSEPAWNIANDGAQVFTGFQYLPMKGIKMSLNYRSWKSADTDKSLSSSIYANFEFSFK